MSANVTSLKDSGLVIIAGLLAGLFFILVPDLALMLILVLILGLGLNANLPGEDREFLIKLFVISFVVRLLVLIFVFCLSILFGGRGEVFPDSRYLTISALQISRIWRSSEVMFLSIELHGINFFTYILAFFYTIINYGANSVSPDPILSDKVLNIIISLITSVSIYYLAKELFGRKVAVLSTIIVSFWPTLIIWSVTNLREPFNILLTTIFLWSSVKYIKSSRFRYGVICLASALCVYGVRPYLFPFSVIMALLTLVIGMRMRMTVKLFIILLLFVSVAFGSKSLDFGKYVDQSESYRENILRMNREIIRQGGMSYSIYDKDTYQNGKIDNFKLVKGFVKGWFHFILVPLPWMVLAFAPLVIYPVIIIWYLLLAMSLVGVYFCIKYQLKYNFVFLTYIFVVTFVFGIVEGNMGSALRHRDLVLPFYLILAVVGYYGIFDKRGLIKTWEGNGK